MIADHYSVSSINYEDTKEWILKKHYAHRMPSISYAFGLFSDNKLVGVCTYGTPASPSLVRGAFNGHYCDCFYELNRLVVNDGLPHNTLSYFVAQTFSMLPKPMVIVSYSDTSMHHNGYIYQATNFVYTGLSEPHKDYYLTESPDMHFRHMLDDLGGINKAREQIELNECQRARKHRYFIVLGSGRQKRRMLRNLQYPILKYPKGKNKRYDASYKPNIQLTLF